jgi:hypothetical protein
LPNVRSTCWVDVLHKEPSWNCLVRVLFYYCSACLVCVNV